MYAGDPENGGYRVVDLSHAIWPGMPMFPGLPGPVVAKHLGRSDSEAHYASGTSFLISRFELVGNTGTYIDSPLHRHCGGKDVSDLPLAGLVNLSGIVVDPSVRSGRLVLDGPDLDGITLAGSALLVRTRWDRLWGGAGYHGERGPYVTAAAARAIAAAKPAVVGIDCLNIDDVEDLSRPVHTILLAAGIPILENLRNLGKLPPRGSRIFAAPLAIRGAASVSVRVFALVR